MITNFIFFENKIRKILKIFVFINKNRSENTGDLLNNVISERFLEQKRNDLSFHHVNDVVRNRISRRGFHL